VALEEPEAKNRRLVVSLNALENPMPAPVITMSPEHHIHLPEELRQRYDWKPGQSLMVVCRETGVFICPPVPVEEAHGIAFGANTDFDPDAAQFF
jgi:bifunctional DNA-binding transcriptional regulator/antitoxin component of YhaV-PrlF toxin-antitoxin module